MQFFKESSTVLYFLAKGLLYMQFIPQAPQRWEITFQFDFCSCFMKFNLLRKI
ncbi:unnamed protein product, partial [Larinioides sclopetarius]